MQALATAALAFNPTRGTSAAPMPVTRAAGTKLNTCMACRACPFTVAIDMGGGWVQPMGSQWCTAYRRRSVPVTHPPAIAAPPAALRHQTGRHHRVRRTASPPFPGTASVSSALSLAVGECPLGNLYTDAYRWRFGADIAFSTCGGLRGPGWPAGTGGGALVC